MRSVKLYVVFYSNIFLFNMGFFRVYKYSFIIEESKKYTKVYNKRNLKENINLLLIMFM